MEWLKKNKVTIGIVFILLIGIGLLAYPSVSDWWNSFHQTRAYASYVEAVNNLDKEEYDRIWANAENYNAGLARDGMKWVMTDAEKEEYEKQLKVGSSEVVGYITIDKIRVELPIYLSTNEAVLQVAVGHLEGTSLPVGGQSTHAVLTGHRGLPSARLFTDLDKIVEGDIFQLKVLDRTLTYQVDQIRIVEPSDLSDLQIEQGKDLCTLVTCTPYGINTHRLLVRGHRVDNPHGDAKVVSDAIIIDSIFVAPVIAVPVLLFILIGFMIQTGRKRMSRREAAQVARVEYEEVPVNVELPDALPDRL